MENKLDFEGLASALLARAGEFMTAWLPGGHMEGREYCCGDIKGGPGTSMKVNLSTGAWADFAADIKGGDLISLFSAIENIKQGEAAKRLADQIGYRLKDDPPAKTGPGPVEHKLVPPPANVALPAMHHPKFGKPSASWTYRDASGAVMFLIARYDPAEGKQFCPWSWSETAGKWVAKGWPAPRPLYGLDRLAKYPDKNVLVVEGEKAADAAQKIMSAYIVVSWANGVNNADKADWSPLKDRRVLVWPDADRKLVKTPSQAERYGLELGALIPYKDQPGIVAAKHVSDALLPICKEVKMLDVGTDLKRLDGWDAADAVEAGWTWKQFFEWAQPRANMVVRAEANAVAGTAIAQAQVNITIKTGEEMGSASMHGIWESLGLAVNSEGQPFPNVDNVRRVMENHKALSTLVWYDEFHQKMFTTWNSKEPRQWEDVDDINLLTYLQRKVGLARISLEAVRNGATGYAKQHVRNEPREWLDSLVWDKESRIHEFISECFGVEHNEYTSAASKNFWVGLVARIYRPGCKVDNMVVLEGPQGTFKSTALEIIGGKWYLEMKESVQSKDFFICLQGKLLAQIAELDSFTRADVTRIKQVISCRSDNYRAPYDRASLDHPRTSVFVGTTNESYYLRDATGGRRFWPIKCTAVRLDKIAADRTQLYAEAVHALAPQTPWDKSLQHYEGGTDWWVMPKEMTEHEQEARRQNDEWEGIIYDFLSTRDEVSVREIAEHMGIDVDKLDRGVQMRIAGIVKNLGFEKHHRNTGGSQGKVWCRKGTQQLL